MGMPLLTPGPTTRGVSLRYRAKKRSTGPVAGGTTDDMMAPVTSRKATPSSSHSPRSREACSSSVRSTRVSMRQSVRSRSPWNRPNTVWVLPMSTARSMSLSLYLVCLLLAGLASGCRKRPIADDPKERGKLSRMAAGLDQAYGSKPLPTVNEPEKLADRLAHWDDFRSCTVRTYVARKREADRRAREGEARPTPNARIGEAAVEECAVEGAVVNKDPTLCERLAADFQPPGGA